MPYETAYIGIATAANGNFDHFVIQLKTSHLFGGYWKFQSIDDDRRANVRGFTTPEDILCAAESTDEDFDEIFIRWVRGANDPNIRMAVSGTPSQHLQTIYELRLLLGLPVSSRGQIPLYPISTKPELRQYWKAKYGVQRPTSINTPSQVPGRPTPSPLTPRSEPSSTSRHQDALSEAPKSPVGRITRARSGKISQAARPTPAARATSARRGPDVSKAHTTPLAEAHSASGPTAVLSPPANTLGEQQAPSSSTASPASTSTPPGPSAGKSIPSIPRSTLAWGLQSSPVPTPSNPGHGVSQHNWIHPFSRNLNAEHFSSSTIPQQQEEPKVVTERSQDAVTANFGLPAPANIPYPYSYAANESRNERLPEAPRHDKKVIAPSKSPSAGESTKKNVATPYNATTPAVSTTSPPASSLSSSLAAPTAPCAFSANAGDVPIPNHAYMPRYANPTTPTRKSQELPPDSSSSPLAPQFSSPPFFTKDAPIEAQVATEESPAGISEESSAAGCANGLLSVDDPSLQQKLGTLHIRPADEDDTSARMRVRPEAIEAISEPWYTYMKGLEELPCMDCGEEDGHLWGCNLGSIKPMQNLTVLDYRNLTDAVQLFDPGPWTTHFNPPELEPEDEETQIRGMAEVIRNEDSYKQDTELHSLPDEFMIMLWAFKTSDKVQVVKETDVW